MTTPRFTSSPAATTLAVNAQARQDERDEWLRRVHHRLESAKAACREVRAGLSGARRIPGVNSFDF